MLTYEFLVGSPPFEAEGYRATSRRISSVDLRFPSIVSPGARDLISRLLVKEQSKRMKLSDLAKHPWIVFHTGPKTGTASSSLKSSASASASAAR